MIDLFKNNYYRQVGTGSKFSVEFDTISNTTVTHTEESKKAAIELYDLKQGELHLCYSGGIDSEFMVSVFIELGMPFTPVLFKYNNNYNKHDLDYSLKFCESKKLTPLIIDIDFDHFVTSGRLLDVCKKIKTSTWLRSGVCEGISNLDGTVLLGDCEPYVNLDQETLTWNFRIDEHEFAWGNLFKQNGIHGTPYFGSYTPGKFISFLKNQRIQDIVNNKLPGKLGTITSKPIVYNSDNNFNLQPRPKYHGYEEIFNSELYVSGILKEIEKELEQYNNGHYAVEIHKFIKMVTCD
jgi:hypothetical protein